MANCLMHDVITVLVIAVVQNEVKAPTLLAIAFPGTPNLLSAALSFPLLSHGEATALTPASYLRT